MDSKNYLLAAAFAGLALTASAADAPKAATKDVKEVDGKCSGINSCKGTSACHSDKNSCAGENSCKGKGWLKTSEKQCLDKKGVFTKKA